LVLLPDHRCFKFTKVTHLWLNQLQLSLFEVSVKKNRQADVELP
jgi:hypothetical protein